MADKSFSTRMPDGHTLITHKTLRDTETNEEFEVQEIFKEVKVGEKQFWKLYLADFLTILGIFESKQLEVLIHILENVSASSNLYIGTYRGLANACDVSVDTVRRIMVKLQDAGFLRKLQNGVYQISPAIMLKGNESKRAMLIRYGDRIQAQATDQPISSPVPGCLKTRPRGGDGGLDSPGI